MSAKSSGESSDEKSDDDGHMSDDGDNSDDGDERSPSLHAFAEQLRGASGYGEDDMAEYMDDLRAEAGTQPMVFTARDVTRALSGRAV